MVSRSKNVHIFYLKLGKITLFLMFSGSSYLITAPFQKPQNMIHVYSLFVYPSTQPCFILDPQRNASRKFLNSSFDWQKHRTSHRMQGRREFSSICMQMLVSQMSVRRLSGGCRLGQRGSKKEGRVMEFVRSTSPPCSRKLPRVCIDFLIFPNPRLTSFKSCP